MTDLVHRNDDGSLTVDPLFAEAVEALALRRIGVDADSIAAGMAELVESINTALARLRAERIGPLSINVTAAPPTRRVVERDDAGNITAIVETAAVDE